MNDILAAIRKTNGIFSSRHSEEDLKEILGALQAAGFVVVRAGLIEILRNTLDEILNKQRGKSHL